MILHDTTLTAAARLQACACMHCTTFIQANLYMVHQVSLREHMHSHLLVLDVQENLDPSSRTDMKVLLTSGIAL